MLWVKVLTWLIVQSSLSLYFPTYVTHKIARFVTQVGIKGQMTWKR